MLCFICLKIGDSKNIQFDTKEADELNIKTIVEQHLGLQLNDAPDTSRAICLKCWKYLLEFHEFYVSVETAHKALTETLINVPIEATATEETNIDETKLSTEHIAGVDENNASAVATTKRKRGRPRRQPLVAAKSQEQKKASPLEIVIDQINLNEIKIELPEADLTMADVLNDGVEFDVDDFMQQDDDASNDETVVQKQKTHTRRGKYNLKRTLEFNKFIESNFQLQCSLCSAGATDFSGLISHYRREHKMRGYATCCNKKFYKRGLLVDHLQRHKNPEYFKCHICAQILSDRRGLEKHISMHDSKNLERIYKCDICTKGFYNLGVFKRHQLTHMPKEERTVQCTHCEKTFPTQYLMTQHVRVVHLNLYAKICELCGKAIRNREAMERHMAEHTGIARQPIQCDICGANLTTKYGLKRHKKMMHDLKNRRFMECPVCYKTSPSLAAHKNHIKFMHNTQRNQQCPMCDKAFKRATELREHMTTHTGEVLYTCPHCPKTFNSNANMHSHRKKMHRAEWEAKRLERYQKREQPKENATIISISQQKTISRLRNTNDNLAGEI